MLDEILKSIKPKMDAILTALANEFRTLHTGRASASLVEDLLIDYYGTKTPLKQMAQITTPQANQILIIPWDQNASKDIENSIRESELGLNPSSEGKQIRIILPPLTEERRRELTKVVKSKSEQSKVIVRNIRRDAWEKIQKSEKEGKITEDDKYDGQEKLNKLIEDHNLKIEKMCEDKEKEIMTV